MAILCSTAALAAAQDRLPTMPRYDRYERLRRDITNSVKRGALTVKWADDSKSFTYAKEGKTYRYDLASGKSAEIEAPKESAERRRSRRNPERGRQFDTVLTEDGKLKAVCRDRNVYLSKADGKDEVAVTTDGSVEKRIKNGVASWVYGEELGVRESMWFCPDGKRLAYYRFDEGPVKDFYLTYDLTKFQNTLDVEAYPKAGTENPRVQLRVYDIASKKTLTIDPTFGDPDMAEYVYQVRWSPDGKELFYHRTNRKQNVMEWCAADPETGRSRVVLRESRPQSWTDNAPALRFLKGEDRFVWRSDRDGFYNLYLYDLAGKLLKTLTSHRFDVDGVSLIDEDQGVLFYTARSAENPYLVQLHRVNLDGTGDVRLTDPKRSHTVAIAPDGKHVVDVAETLDVPAETRLLDRSGKVVATLETSDLTKFEELRLRKIQRITFPAADGSTTLYGTLELPSDFDPKRRYPVVVGTYAGPESGGGQERFRPPSPLTELGFIIADFDGRGTSGRGKAFKEAVYGKLGIVEIDDQAAGARYLASLPYVDGKRIGIHGTSYGGYASAMAILRHPDVFAAACASSSVTDWRHYDTIYTERYMGLPSPEDNLAGYDAGSSMKYAKNLKGRLMLFYGSLDNNVHPSNTLMLAKSLNEAGKSYEMMVGPDQGHTGINYWRMWEFFMDNLVLRQASSEPLKKIVSRRKGS
ncbi:MAG TPA: DPP IV N-terminal domain-containing protein [Fimbriimonas sp.]